MSLIYTMARPAAKTLAKRQLEEGLKDPDAYRKKVKELQAKPLPLDRLHKQYAFEQEYADGTVYYRIRSHTADGKHVILYFHGGGFIMGSIEDHDPLCGKLADAAGAIVIAAEYRLAPEDPFPACIEDAVCLAEWAHKNAAAYGGDPERIMAAGDSSGAAISAALALLAKDGKAPAISGLILLYGVFGCISLEDSESVKLYGQGDCVLPADAIRKMMDLYIPEGTDPCDIRLYPGKAADLSGMPPAMIVTAELDPLRDDGECFARRLRESGCNAKLIRMDGMMHGFALYWQRFSKAKTMLDLIGSIVKSWTK
jgi:acetyl esterase